MRGCYPQGLRRTLDQLPETLDATYERTLLRIEKSKQGYASRLFQCLAVAIRPLRVEELAEILAVLLDAGEDSEYHVDWRPEDAQQAVLSTCSSLVTVINDGGSSIVQFSHFSVKEFLTSSRLANAGEPLSHYHILSNSAQAILARACLSVLLDLGDHVDKSTIKMLKQARSQEVTRLRRWKGNNALRASRDIKYYSYHLIHFDQGQSLSDSPRIICFTNTIHKYLPYKETVPQRRVCATVSYFRLF